MTFPRIENFDEIRVFLTDFKFINFVNVDVESIQIINNFKLKKVNLPKKLKYLKMWSNPSLIYQEIIDLITSNLTKLDLEDSTQEELDLKNLQQLQWLTLISLSQLKQVRNLPSNLTNLYLVFNGNLNHQAILETANFPQLGELHIDNITKFDSKRFPSLKNLSIWTSTIKELNLADLKLTKLEIHELPNLNSVKNLPSSIEMLDVQEISLKVNSILNQKNNLKELKITHQEYPRSISDINLCQLSETLSSFTYHLNHDDKLRLNMFTCLNKLTKFEISYEHNLNIEDSLVFNSSKHVYCDITLNELSQNDIAKSGLDKNTSNITVDLSYNNITSLDEKYLKISFKTRMLF